MEQIQTIGIWMMTISMSLMIFALVLAVIDQRPPKDPHKR